MIELIQLNWHYLAGQPVDHFLRLLPWHLSALLVAMGLLSALGLHFLIGYLFRFYRRKERHARWIAWPTGLVLICAVYLLLGAYLLGTRAQILTTFNLSDRLESRLGEMLLAPAFTSPALAAQPEDAVGMAALRAALFSYPEADYRAGLAVLANGPSTQGATTGDTSPVPGLTANEWRMAQIGLRWVASPHRTWLAPLRPKGATGEERPSTERGEESSDGYFLPEFLLGLVNELPPDVPLPREDWEHVAGTRFVGGYLEPLMVEYLSYLSLSLSLAVLLVLVLYFLLMARLRRIGQPGPAKGKTMVKGNVKPEADVSIPATADLPVTAEAPAPLAVDAGKEAAATSESAKAESTSEATKLAGENAGDEQEKTATSEPASTAATPDEAHSGPSGDGGDGSTDQPGEPSDAPPPAPPSRWKSLSEKFLPGSRRS